MHEYVNLLISCLFLIKKTIRFPKHLEKYSDSLKEYEEKKEKNSEEFDHEFVPVNDKLDVDVLNNGLLNVWEFLFEKKYCFFERIHKNINWKYTIKQ